MEDISKEELAVLISQFIHHENKEEISKILALGLANSSNGKNIFLKTLCGASSELLIQKHNFVLFDAKYLWQLNDDVKKVSIQEGLILTKYDQLWCRGVVKNVNIMDTYPIELEYNLVYPEKRTTSSIHLKEHQMILDQDMHYSLDDKDINAQLMTKFGIPQIYIQELKAAPRSRRNAFKSDPPF